MSTIDQRAAKIGWLSATALPLLALLATTAGLIPFAGFLVSLIAFLFLGVMIKRTVAAAIKLGALYQVYGRVGLGACTVLLIMMSSASPEAGMGSFVVPIVLSLLVLDRLCGYVGRGEMRDVEAERTSQAEADHEFDLLKPLPATVADVPEPEASRPVVSVTANLGPAQTVIPTEPVTDTPGSFSRWMTGSNKGEVATGS